MGSWVKTLGSIFAAVAVAVPCFTAANTFHSRDLSGDRDTVYNEGLVLRWQGATLPEASSRVDQKPVRSGATIVLPDWAGEGKHHFQVRGYSIRYGLPDWDESSDEIRLTYQYRVPISEYRFIETQSFLGRTTVLGRQEDLLQTVGYGIRLLDSDTVAFEIIPGLARAYGGDLTAEERAGWIGNIGQQLTWNVAGDFSIHQRLNTFVERTAADYLSAVVNLDVETLLTEQLSFKISYEVHYDDSMSSEMERRERRVSTAIGIRF